MPDNANDAPIQIYDYKIEKACAKLVGPWAILVITSELYFEIFVLDAR